MLGSLEKSGHGRRRGLGVAAIAAALALPLTACFDGRLLVDIKDGGATEIELEMRFAPEFSSVFDLVAAVDALQPQTNRPPFRSLCHAIALGINESSELKKAPPPVVVTVARESTTGDRPVCTLRLAIEKPLTDEVIAKLGEGLKKWNDEAASLMPGLVLPGTGVKIATDGPRRVRIESNPGPPLNEKQTRELFIAFVRKAFEKEKEKGIPGLAPGAVDRIFSDANLSKLIDSGMRANLAVYRMLLKGYEDYRIDFELRVPRVIETNLDRKGEALTIGQSYREVLAALADPQSVRPRRLVLVFEY